MLVTGATGLIGEAVTAALERTSVELHTSSRTPSASARHHAADLTSPTAVDALLEAAAPDVVIHVAGGRGDDLAELRRSNVESTRNLLEGLIRVDARPYVVVSGSAAEYGDSATGPIREDAPLRPVSEYGRVKVEQTSLARRLSSESGIPLTVARIFNVVSPRLPSSTALGNMRRQLLAQTGPQRTLRAGRLDVIRDYVPVAFVAETLARLAGAPADEPVLNVCSGVGISLSEIVSELASTLRVEVVVEQLDELTTIPAATEVVGDPRRLASLGLRCRPTAATIAAALLAH